MAAQQSSWGPGKIPSQRKGLHDIMSEQLAESFDGVVEESFEVHSFCALSFEEEFDFALALQLQEEEDADFSADLAQVQKFQPRGNVTLKFLSPLLPRIHSQPSQEHFEEEEEIAHAPMCWPSKARDKSLKGQGGEGEIITKHDPEVCFFRNGLALEKFVPANACGGAISPMSNQAFNSLSQKVKKQTDRAYSSSTLIDSSKGFPKGLTKQSLRILQQMINNQLLHEVNGIVRSGKEANVFHASLSEKEYAIKVFRTCQNEFSNRNDYLVGDHRFAEIDVTRLTRDKIITLWTEKEFQNLSRLYHEGLPCPIPLQWKKNILLMSFVGERSICAPQLAEVKFERKSLKRSCFIQCLLLLHAMYHRCRLVHADFSEYNVLFWQSKCVLVDVGQAVDLSHPLANQYLHRDVKNILNFFIGRRILGRENLVEDVVNWIVVRPQNVKSDDPQFEEWKTFAKGLGEWADGQVAMRFATLMDLLF